MSTEVFTLPTDAEEREELVAAGFLTVDLGNNDGMLSLSQDVASISAAASFYLRRMGQLAQERARIEATRRREHEMIDAVYNGQVARLDGSLGELRKKMEQLIRVAKQLGAFAKRKTIAVAGGAFGLKGVPARTTIADPAATLAWAEASAPAAVRLTLQLTLAEARELFTESELRSLEKKREVLLSTLGAVEGVEIKKVPGVASIAAGEDLVVNPEIIE